MRLEGCLLVSAILHGLVFLPGLQGWFSPTETPLPPPVQPRMQVRLQPPRQRLSGSPQAVVAAAPLPGQPGARPQPHPQTVSAPRTPSQPNVAAMTVPALPRGQAPARSQQGYPVRHPTRTHSQAPAAGEGLGEIALDPPVMIKGPMKIPVPAFLRNRDGQFLLTLRVRVETDGSTQVSVMEGTGAPDLDESVRQSFSGLTWYRAELAGKPVAVTVRLVIDGEWQYGQDAVDWGGRIPPME